MGFLTALKVVSIEHSMHVDHNRILEIQHDASLMKEELGKLLSDLETGDVKDADKELSLLKKNDLVILKDLKKIGDEHGFEQAQAILKLIYELMRSSEAFNQFKDSEDLIETIRLDLNHLLSDELKNMKIDDEILREFLQIYNSPYITEDNVNDFNKKHANFLKAKPHKRIRKLINNVLKEKTNKSSLETKGPTIKEKELIAITTRLDEFLSSRYFMNIKNIVKNEPIMIGIYGSLVTGFASKYSHHAGQPSDFKRVSDVDLGIVLKTDFLKKLSIDLVPVVKQGLYYGPIKEQNAERASFFSKIFYYMKGLSFAGKTDRNIGFIFVDFDFYKNNLSKDKHIILFKGTF